MLTYRIKTRAKFFNLETNELTEHQGDWILQAVDALQAGTTATDALKLASKEDHVRVVHLQMHISVVNEEADIDSPKLP